MSQTWISSDADLAQHSSSYQSNSHRHRRNRRPPRCHRGKFAASVTNMTVLTPCHLHHKEKAKRRRKPRHLYPRRVTPNRRTIIRRSRVVDDTQKIRKRRRSTKPLPSIQTGTTDSTSSLMLLSATRTSDENFMLEIASVVVTTTKVSGLFRNV